MSATTHARWPARKVLAHRNDDSRRPQRSNGSDGWSCGAARSRRRTTAGKRRPGRPMAVPSRKPRPASTRWASSTGIGSRSCRGTGRSGRKPTSDPLARRDQRARVPDERRATSRIRPRALGKPGLLRRRRRTAGSSARSNATGCRRSSTSWSSTNESRWTTHCCSRSRSSERSGAQALDRDPDVVARACDVDHAGRRRHDRLHERHNRSPQGSGAHARQRHGDVAFGHRARAALARRPLPVVSPVEPHHRAFRLAFRPDRVRRRDLVRAFDLDRCRGLARLPAHDLLRGPARLGEDPRGCRSTASDGISGVRGRAARTYLSLAFARARELETQQYMPFPTKVAWLALDRTVGAQLRAQLGLDRTRITVSGAAPIHPDLVRWFNGVGLQLAEGYGQTEVALATTMNPPGASRVGTVGPPLPGVSVRIADDGEILIKGDNVCRGLLARRGRNARSSSTTTAGCVPATSARSTITATCASPGARRI